MQFIILFISFIITIPVFSEPLSKPPFTLDDSKKYVNITPEVMFLKDKKSIMSLKEVLEHRDRITRDNGDVLEWKRSNSQILNLGLTNSTFWFKVDVEDKIKSRNALFEINRNHFDRLELFAINRDNSIRKIDIGKPGFSFVGKSFQLSQTTVDIGDQRDNIKTILIAARMKNYPFYLSFKLWNPRPHILKQLIWGSLNVAFFSGILIMSLYNLSIFFTIRDRSYLYYSVAMMAFAILNGVFEGVSQLIFSEGYDWLNRRLIPLNMGVCGISIGLFVSSFLRTKETTLFFHRVSRVLQLIGGLLILATCISNKTYIMFYIAMVYCSIGFMALLAVSTLVVYRGYKPARSFLAGYLLNIISVFGFAFMIFEIIDPNFISVYGMYVGSALQTIIFSRSLGEKIKDEQMKARQALEASNAQLNKYIGVEKETVKEKTARISSIMKHVKIGILTIGKDGRIKEEYTEELEKIVEEQDLFGKDFSDILFKHSQLSSDERSQVKHFLNGSLGEDSINFEANSHLAPKEMIISKKIVAIEFNPIEKDDEVEEILVSLKDVTQQRSAEEAAQKSKREIRIMEQIVNISSKKFDYFMETSRDAIKNNRILIKENKDISEEALKLLYINLHTMKGSARTYDFSFMTGEIHDAEQKYSDMQKRTQTYSQSELLEDLNKIEFVIDEYDHISTEKLGREKMHNRSIVENNLIKNIYAFMSNNAIEATSQKKPHLRKQQNKIVNELEDIYFSKTEDIIKESLERVESLAKDLGKENPEIEIIGESRGINKQGSDLLHSVLVHMIRNSLDHGIESAEERRSLGKKDRGKIVFNGTNSMKGWNLEYYDDGKGLDLERIRALAVSKGILKEDSPLRDQEIAELILISGFSTAHEVTDISGRGVGMDAVKSYIERSGGNLKIQLGSKKKSTGYVSFSLHITIANQFLNKSSITKLKCV